MLQSNLGLTDVHKREFESQKNSRQTQEHLQGLTALQAPRDKLVCILNCCRIINNLLHLNVGQGEARGRLKRARNYSRVRSCVLL